MRGIIAGRMAAGGNVYDKYASSNPVERRLVAGFLGHLSASSRRARGAREAHEVGCGEGELAIRLARAGLRVRGSDVSAEVIEEARRRAAAAGVEIDYRAAPVEALEPRYDAAELVVCCEVLEHLADPDAALATLAGLARPWLLVSVPREPLWRASTSPGSATSRELGNTPGHLGHWSKRGFVAFLARAGRGRGGAQPAAVDDGALPGGPRVSAARRFAAWVRARPGTLAIVCLGIAWGAVIHTTGWAQLAHFAEVRALASGSKTIDRWHWETGDIAWIDGHYYSVKSPGDGGDLRPRSTCSSTPPAVASSPPTPRPRRRRPTSRAGPPTTAPVHVVRLRRRARGARSAAGRGRDSRSSGS